VAAEPVMSQGIHFIHCSQKKKVNRFYLLYELIFHELVLYKTMVAESSLAYTFDQIFGMTKKRWHLRCTSETFCVPNKNVFFTIDILLNNLMAKIEE